MGNPIDINGNVTRVVVADDSATAREQILSILESDPTLEIVGVAANGVDAISVARETRPDVIVMDIDMPLMDGFDATRAIMHEFPTPVIIMSAALDVQEVGVSKYALRSGAVCVMMKPVGPIMEDFDSQARHFIAMVHSMGQIQVARKPRTTRAMPGELESIPLDGAAPRAIGICASTGGPAALHHLLSELPPSFPVPILIAQQMEAAFVEDFITSLSMVSSLNVRIASAGERLQPRTVYVAPGNRHFSVDHDERVVLEDAVRGTGIAPCPDRLFKSMAHVYGDGTVAVVLSGSEVAGIDGLTEVWRYSGRILTQSPVTARAAVLPAAVEHAGLADAVLHLPVIPTALIAMTAAGRNATPTGAYSFAPLQLSA